MAFERLNGLLLPDTEVEDNKSRLKLAVREMIEEIQSPDDCLKLIREASVAIWDKEIVGFERILNQSVFARALHLAETWPRISDDQILDSINKGRKNGKSNQQPPGVRGAD